MCAVDLLATVSRYSELASTGTIPSSSSVQVSSSIRCPLPHGRVFDAAAYLRLPRQVGDKSPTTMQEVVLYVYRGEVGTLVGPQLLTAIERQERGKCSVCRVLSLASQAGASAHNGWLIKTSLQPEVAQSLKSASGAQRQASSAVMSGGRTSYLRVTQVGALPMVTRSCQWPKLASSSSPY